MGRLLALSLLGIALALLGERFLALRNQLKASREIESVDLPNCHLIKGIGSKISSPPQFCTR
uniref:Serum paraoxonase/lactonase 3 n=1 Tax=Catagonus wagneri TaxID=51154 RepID=A0A8C3VSX0_9CETA